MTKRVLVPIATGFEEIEALTVVDILRRAQVEVVLAGVEETAPVKGRSDISVMPDMSLDEALSKESYDMIVLPGGLPNSHILRDDKRITAAVKEQVSWGGYVGAICAAPLVLKEAGVLEGRRVTSHPLIMEELAQDDYSEERVVTAGRVLTSRGPGTAMEFAFAIVRELLGQEAADEVNKGVLAILD